MIGKGKLIESAFLVNIIGKLVKRDFDFDLKEMPVKLGSKLSSTDLVYSSSYWKIRLNL